MRSPLSKIALTEIVDQAHNSNERPRLREPARRSRRLGKLCRIAFTRRRSSAQITSGGIGSCLTQIDLDVRRLKKLGGALCLTSLTAYMASRRPPWKAC